MAKWKKIIVSGSEAELLNITASAGLPLKLPNLITSGADFGTPLLVDDQGTVLKATIGVLSSSHALTADTASYIDPSSIDGQVGFPYSGSDDITTSTGAPQAVVTGSLLVGGVASGLNRSGGNITASGGVIAETYHVSSSGVRLAEYSASILNIGNHDTNTTIQANQLVVTASGGITASIIPETTNPPFVLAQLKNDQVVKIPLASIGSSGETSTVNNNVIDNFTTCSDNTNIGLTVTTTGTSEVETLIGEIIINDLGSSDENAKLVKVESNDLHAPAERNQFMFKAGTGYSSGSVNVGDIVRIKNNASTVINGEDDLNVTSKIRGIYNKSVAEAGSAPFTSSIGISGMSAWRSDLDKLVGFAGVGYGAFFSASLDHSLTSGHVYKEGELKNLGDKLVRYRSDLTYFLYKVTAQSSSTVEICLDDNLTLSNVTLTGSLLFSGSSLLDDPAATHSISYAPDNHLNITASNIQVDDNVNIDGTLSFDGFSFSDGDILVTSGSTTFGSGSGNTHEFTGSLFVSGNITLDSGSEDFTSKLIGTASHADNAATSSHALFASSSTSASYAVTSSFSLNAITSSHAILASSSISASHSSFAITASYIDSDSIDGQVGFPYSGSDFIGLTGTPDAAVITGSLFVFGSGSHFSASGHITASGIVSASGFIGDLIGTASHATTASNAIFASSSISSSFATTASYVKNAETASYIDAEDIDGLLGVGFPYSGSDHFASPSHPESIGAPIAVITGSLFLSGSGHITASGDVKVNKNLEVDGDLTVHGNMIVSGTQTTIHTEDLVIEDRFIVLGSGSNATSNVDVGIIFDSGSIDGGGMGLFFDNSANRLAIGKGLSDTIISNTSSNYEVGNPNEFPGGNPLDMGTVGGNIMTIRSTGSLGTQLNTGDDVQFGKGEMLIDNDDDIWIYV